MGQNLLYRSTLPKYFSSRILDFEQVLNCSHDNSDIHILMWSQLQHVLVLAKIKNYYAAVKIMVADLYLKPSYESLDTILMNFFSYCKN